MQSKRYGTRFLYTHYSICECRWLSLELACNQGLNTLYIYFKCSSTHKILYYEPFIKIRIDYPL